MKCYIFDDRSEKPGFNIVAPSTIEWTITQLLFHYHQNYATSLDIIIVWLIVFVLNILAHSHNKYHKNNSRFILFLKFIEGSWKQTAMRALNSKNKDV